MIVAAVPIKRLDTAKSRLSPRFTPAERVDLSRGLLRNVVAALRSSGCIDRVALATPQPELAAWLRVEALPDGGDLNRSLEVATRWATGLEAGSLLIVPADLPLVTSEDIRALIAAAPEPRGICIAPTHDGGTGGLVLSPPAVIPPAFGAGSFERHIRLAREAGEPAVIVKCDGFAYDVDCPADVDRLRSRSGV